MRRRRSRAGSRTSSISALRGSYAVDAVDTERRATMPPRSAARPPRSGYDVVVAFGGDGTVNEAANGLAGTGTPLTCLPGGSANVYCRMLRDPTPTLLTRPSICLRLAGNWHHAPGRPLHASTVLFSVLGRRRPGRQRRPAGRLPPAASCTGSPRRVRRRLNKDRDLRPRRYLLRPPRHGCRARFLTTAPTPAPSVEGVTVVVQNGFALHLLRRPWRRDGRGRLPAER